MSLLEEPAVTVGVIGAMVSLVTLFLNILVSVRTQRVARFLEVTEGSLEFKKQQVDELYGPLLALIMQNKALAERLKDMKGSDFQLLDSLPGILEEPNLSSLIDLLLHNNKRMETLIFTKSSLIRENQYPASVIRFLGHCGVLESAKSDQPLAIRKPEDYYPEEFDGYVRNSYEQLKKEVDDILSERSRLVSKKIGKTVNE